MLSLLCVSAMPVQSNNGDIKSDLDILNFALTLEHLESAFYKEGMSKFTSQSFKDAGFGDNIYPLFQQIAGNENTHVTKLTSVIQGLNGTPVPACKYDFKLTDVQSFVDTSKALENTGVSAYLGASKDILDHNILSLAASILTVEARQGATLNFIEKDSPFPNNFDVGLDPREIISIASQFIVECSYELPKSFPPFKISQESGKVGDSVSISFDGKQDNLYCAFLAGGGYNYFVPLSEGQCKLPEDIMLGDIFIILTTASKMDDFNDGTTIAGPASFTIEK